MKEIEKPEEVRTPERIRLEEEVKEVAVRLILRETGYKPRFVMERLDKDMYDDMGVDSVQMVSILARIETEYDLDISEEDAHKIRTPNDLIRITADYIEDQ